MTERKMLFYEKYANVKEICISLNNLLHSTCTCDVAMYGIENVAIEENHSCTN